MIFSIYMSSMHHTFISGKTLTPKLNIGAFAAIMSKLVMLTMPTHYQNCNSQHSQRASCCLPTIFCARNETSTR